MTLTTPLPLKTGFRSGLIFSLPAPSASEVISSPLMTTLSARENACRTFRVRLYFIVRHLNPTRISGSSAASTSPPADPDATRLSGSYGDLSAPDFCGGTGKGRAGARGSRFRGKVGSQQGVPPATLTKRAVSHAPPATGLNRAFQLYPSARVTGPFRAPSEGAISRVSTADPIEAYCSVFRPSPPPLFPLVRPRLAWLRRPPAKEEPGTVTVYFPPCECRKPAAPPSRCLRILA